MKKKTEKMTYAASGVDVRAGENAVEKIKSLAASTFNSQVLTGLGAFGGFFAPDMGAYRQPVFVSSADGVGTKLKIAYMTDRHDTVGSDLVNHCINDILVHGARALFFLDYIGVGKLRQEVIVAVIDGLARACKENGVALIGGEMAELPDMYRPGEYDLAGFVVGIVDKEKIVDGSAIREGDICLGLPSNGLHTNGYSLARKVAFEVGGFGPDDHVEQLDATVSEALMKVHTCYASIIHPLTEKFDIHGMAHITGGGIPGNLKRVLPDGLTAAIDKSTWPVPPVFEWLREVGNIDPDDIYTAFNMGIGYIMVVDPDDAEGIIGDIAATGEKIYRIGSIKKGEKGVSLV